MRVDDDLLGRVDAVRGQVPRATWIKAAIERSLQKSPSDPEGKDLEPLRAGVDLKAAPDATRSGYVKPFEPRPKP